MDVASVCPVVSIFNVSEITTATILNAYLVVQGVISAIMPAMGHVSVRCLVVMTVNATISASFCHAVTAVNVNSFLDVYHAAMIQSVMYVNA